MVTDARNLFQYRKKRSPEETKRSIYKKLKETTSQLKSEEHGSEASVKAIDFPTTASIKSVAIDWSDIDSC